MYRKNNKPCKYHVNTASFHVIHLCPFCETMTLYSLSILTLCLQISELKNSNNRHSSWYVYLSSVDKADGQWNVYLWMGQYSWKLALAFNDKLYCLVISNTESFNSWWQVVLFINLHHGLLNYCYHSSGIGNCDVVMH